MPSARKDNLKSASEASKRILCLPIYPDLDPAQVERIVGIVASTK
ncbi:DegT/DnrJ/EryC1/StrS family aminotransferase [Paraburkholderia sp. SIMBA_009]